MKKFTVSIILLAVLGAGIMTPVTSAHAVQNPPPPTIVFFEADIEGPVTLKMVEAAQTHFTLKWHIIHVRPGDRLLLETYRGRAWTSLVEDGETLPTVGSREMKLTHPLNFGPPTYRLSIMNDLGLIVDERTVVISYDTNATLDPPQIASFTSKATSVDATALRAGAAWVPVEWEVVNRTPTTNLIFEQVNPDGSTKSVELPRTSYWVASAGEGIVAPESDTPPPVVPIRLSVIDVITGGVFDAAEIELQVTGAANNASTPTPFPLSTVEPPPGGPNVLSFTAKPETAQPNGDIILEWETNNAQKVWIEQYRADQAGQGFTQYTPPDQLYADLPPSGSLTVTLTGEYTDQVATFILIMDEYDVNVRGPGARVDVPVDCQYEFFFEGGEGCPSGPAKEVAGAYQAFETGHMLWRSDTGQVYVHYSNGTAAYYSQNDLDNMADNPVTDSTPPGQYKPVNAFGRVWGNSTEVKVRLGWAVTPEQGYTMTVQSATGQIAAGKDYLTLPDGQVVGTGLSRWEFKQTK